MRVALLYVHSDVPHNYIVIGLSILVRYLSTLTMSWPWEPSCNAGTYPRKLYVRNKEFHNVSSYLFWSSIRPHFQCPGQGDLHTIQENIQENFGYILWDWLGYLHSSCAHRRRTLAYLQSRDEPMNALGRIF